MAAGKLANVAAQVLLAHVMIGAVVATLEHRPEAFDSVGVGHAVHMLADAVLHCFVLERHSLISAVAVCIDSRAGVGVFTDETLERLGVCAVYHGSTHAIGRPVLGANHCGLTDRATARAKLLVGVFVLFLAADVGFVNFDRA